MFTNSPILFTANWVWSLPWCWDSFEFYRNYYLLCIRCTYLDSLLLCGEKLQKENKKALSLQTRHDITHAKKGNESRLISGDMQVNETSYICVE